MVDVWAEGGQKGDAATDSRRQNYAAIFLQLDTNNSGEIELDEIIKLGLVTLVDLSRDRAR